MHPLLDYFRLITEFSFERRNPVERLRMPMSAVKIRRTAYDIGMHEHVTEGQPILAYSARDQS